jgi:hypothetical protein
VSFPEAKCREIVATRSGGKCEVAIAGVCRGVAESMHHRRKEGRLWNPANVLHACGDGVRGCHGWIESHPKDANEKGLWLFAGEAPAETSVHMRWENQMCWFLLDDEGLLHWDSTETEPVPPPARGSTIFICRR